jgi:hypothetical protein
MVCFLKCNAVKKIIDNFPFFAFQNRFGSLTLAEIRYNFEYG